MNARLRKYKYCYSNKGAIYAKGLLRKFFGQESHRHAPPPPPPQVRKCPYAYVSAMLSFSIRERILSGILTMKFGSTPDQLVATNSTG